MTTEEPPVPFDATDAPGPSGPLGPTAPGSGPPDQAGSPDARSASDPHGTADAGPASHPHGTADARPTPGPHDRADARGTSGPHGPAGPAGPLDAPAPHRPSDPHGAADGSGPADSARQADASTGAPEQADAPGTPHPQGPAGPLDALAPHRPSDPHDRPDPTLVVDPLDTPDPTLVADPLDTPDPHLAADRVVTETLVRAYVRETGLPVPASGEPLRLSMPSSGLTLEMRVAHHSDTGWHRFSHAEVLRPGEGGPLPADVSLVAAALVREAAYRGGLPPHRVSDAVGRVLASAGRIAVHLERRRDEGTGLVVFEPVHGAGSDSGEEAATLPRTAEQPPPARRGSVTGAPGFLEAEQALLLGHPFHPAAKAREEASEHELDSYSPELRGHLRTHWFAAHPDVVVGESADGDLADVLRSAAAGVPVPDGMIPVPAHPWQARSLAERPAVAELLDAGLLRPLGPVGPAWWPTSSLRTVYRPDAGVMMKLSLGMRITNSRRNNLRSEMRLGVRAARLLAAGPQARLAAEHPSFRILRDFAWVSVGTHAENTGGGPHPIGARTADGRGTASAAGPSTGPETGLETALRDNPFRGLPSATGGAATWHAGIAGPATWDAGIGEGLCVAGLLAERPGPGDGRPPCHRALLCEAVTRTAAAYHLSVPEASERWFAAYLDVLAVPLLRLQGWYGLAVEPHHQNTLVSLGADGLPRAGWYRDSQGYYLAASRVADAERLLPGVTEGVDLVFDDAFVDERVAYYLGINNLLGIVGAFGALRLAEEGVLLRVLRRRLERLRAAEPGVKGVLDLLLDAPMLRCKGNLLTCVHGLDELVGDVHTQSVYIDLPNPLAEAKR